jgi:hypothetical protein
LKKDLSINRNLNGAVRFTLRRQGLDAEVDSDRAMGAITEIRLISKDYDRQRTSRISGTRQNVLVPPEAENQLVRFIASLTGRLPKNVLHVGNNLPIKLVLNTSTLLLTTPFG